MDHTTIAIIATTTNDTIEAICKEYITFTTYCFDRDA